jgi:hypothetical protein
MKRALGIILIAVVLLSSCVVFPKAYTSVEIAYGLNILRGTGSGLDEAYLSSVPTRSNAAMIILRLLGLEDEALEYEETATFRDASSAAPYWQPILAYLYANPSVGFSGFGDGTFNPNGSINAKMLAKVLLTVLGYRQDVDFSWNSTLLFAESVGLRSLKNKAGITNTDVAVALVEALNIRTKEGYTLVTELVAADVISLERAEKYGFVVESTEVMISGASVTGVRSITVQFFMPVSADTSVVLRKDLIGIANTYEFSANRKKLVITTSATLSPGTYTVVVGGAVQNLTVETEKAQSLVITGDRLYKTFGQDIGLRLLNQYGEPMPLTDVTVSATNKTSGTRKVIVNKTETSVLIDAALTNIGDQIYIYALDNKTLLSDSVQLTVQSVPAIKRISVTEVAEASGKERIFEDTSMHVIKLSAYDQYGQVYKVRQADIDSGSLMLISSNSLSVSVSSIRVNSEGNLLFNAGKAGDTRLHIIVKEEGISTSADIQVSQAPFLSSIKAEQLPSTIFKNERIEVNVMGYDQYGNIYEMTAADAVSYTSSDTAVVPTANIQISNGVLSFNTLSSGVATVNYSIKGGIQPLLTVNVNDGNVPYIVTGMNLPFTHFEKGVKNVVLDLDDVVVVDQYGNPNSLSSRPSWDTVEWGVYIDKVSGNSFAFSGNTFSTTDIPGTDVFNIYITRDGRIMDRSGYSFSLTNVDSENIQIFDIEVPEVIYGGANNRIDAHTKYISIRGYTLSNERVMLKTDQSGLPTVISSVTVTGNKVYVDTATWAIKFHSYYTENDIVTVKFWKESKEVKSADIVVLAAESKVSRIEYDANQSFVISSREFYTEPLRIYDQYDITANLPSNTRWLCNSNFVDSITFDPVAKRLKIVVRGTVTTETEAIISYIAPDGSFAFRGFYTIMPGTY